MVTNQGQVALAKSREAPGSWSQRCWDCPLSPQLGCTLPHSCLFLPCTWYGRQTPLRRLRLLCPRSGKATILVPYSVPTYCRHRPGVACADSWRTWSPGFLVFGLEHCIAGLGRHWYPPSDQVPSPWPCTMSPLHSQQGHEHRV